MSRLQKKKALSEKKKKPVTENQTDLSAGSSKFSSSKSSTVTSPLKAKREKNLADAKVGEPNFIQKAMEFFREVKVELKKVTWPTKKQTTGTTVVVIVFVFVVAAFLGLFDLGLSKLVQVVLT
ncbi:MULTISPECIES: preprotein translocase subunit SecE [Desulfobacula]|uniref:Protein translocase subunit SecE n=2 Tax=Desulfobacula TaxID=28222 RepID=K0NJI9_DESTT|nr:MULTISPECIES: preprotein translocase subunit SecE [Desulfobacula]CCK81651.1 SecE: predicted preprotein translocase, subunit E [Desulfobacula toluolica Tol2]SDU65087.1 preprotein translocase subunit SecE [Desulfobacula phenolica]